MTTPELWLLRHGATEWVLNGRHTGSTDLPLLAQGEAEARALAPLLAQQTFAAVYSSPLQRARRTCELAGLGAQAQIEPDLREWDYGRYEGITTAEIRQEVPGWTVFSHPCPGGESLEQVQQRCEGLISRLTAQQLPGGILFQPRDLLELLHRQARRDAEPLELQWVRAKVALFQFHRLALRLPELLHERPAGHLSPARS